MGEDTIERGARLGVEQRAELLSRVRERYEAGASIRELAESTGRSYGAMNRLLREGGVVLRGRGGANNGRRAERG